MDKKNKAILEMLTCAALWSIAGIFIKQIPWNALAICSARSLFAGLTLLVFIKIKKYRIIINKRTVVTGLIMGLLFTAFVLANKLTTAANAIVLQFTAPLFIVIFSAVIFHERISRNDLIAVLCTMVGITMFFLDELEGGYLIGNFVAIGSGALMAAMYMSMGNAEGEERFSAIFLGQLTAFIIGLPAIVITQPVFTTAAVIRIVILGVFQLGIPYILFAKASEYCPPLACSLLGAVEPLLNPVWVFLFDGERPGLFALIGAVIVVASVTVWCAFGNKKEEQNA